MLIYVNTIKCCACETLNLVQSSITMAGFDGWLSAMSCVRLATAF